jgi:hypothetical protein
MRKIISEEIKKYPLQNFPNPYGGPIPENQDPFYNIQGDYQNNRRTRMDSLNNLPSEPTFSDGRPSNDAYYHNGPSNPYYYNRPSGNNFANQPIHIPGNNLNANLGSVFLPKEDFSKFEVNKNTVEEYAPNKKK